MSSRARVAGSAGGAIATAPNAFLAAALTSRPSWVAASGISARQACGQRRGVGRVVPLDLRPCRSEISLPPGELGLGQPGRGLAGDSSRGTDRCLPAPRGSRGPAASALAAIQRPWWSRRPGLAQASPARSSAQAQRPARLADPDDDGIADHADRGRLELACRRPRPSRLRSRAPAGRAWADEPHRPAPARVTAAPIPAAHRGRRRDRGQCPRSAVSPCGSGRRVRRRPARLRPVCSRSRQRSAQARMYGWLSTAFSVAGWSRSSAASRDQAPRRPALAARGTAGAASARLVDRAQQPADQAVLGLDELRPCRPRHRSPPARAWKLVPLSACDGDVQPVRGPGRQAAADVRDQREQVRAVDRRVVEAIARPVAVGVETAAAAGDDRAFLAGLAQPGGSLLAGLDARMRGDDIEGVAEDVRPGFRRAVERRFQRVHLLVAAVGLDDHQAGRVQPQGLGIGSPRPAGWTGSNRRSGSATGIRPPATGRRSRSASPRTRCPLPARTGRRMVPGRVGQQEIDPGRPQIHQ